MLVEPQPPAPRAARHVQRARRAGPRPRAPHHHGARDAPRPVPRPTPHLAPPRPDAATLLERYRTAAVALSRDLAAREFDVPVPLLETETRGRADAAFARQVAMYLAHTVFGLSQAQVADRFGRDRTTVRHACALVEDRRDDPRTLARLRRLETTLGTARDALHLFAHAVDDRALDAALRLPRTEAA